MHGTAQCCTICNDKFNTTTKQPLLLQCFHTFCQECLKQLINHNNVESSIACSLCSKITPCSSLSSLSINHALKDLLEAAQASVDRKCEMHDEDHPATHWCFDCEQGMCNDAYSIHSKAKATKSHQTSEISDQPSVVYRQAICGAHGKELDLMCLHDSHSPLSVCISCFITSHQGHPCVTVSDFVKGKVAEGQALLQRAKVIEAKISQGVEIVSKEQALLPQIYDVTAKIDAYFAQIQSELQKRRNELVQELTSRAQCIDKILAAQHASLVATMDGIQTSSKILDATLGDTNPKIKVLQVMEQLSQQLIALEDVNTKPKELAYVGFQGASFILPTTSLTRPDTYSLSVHQYFPMILSTNLPINRFEIFSTHHGLTLKIENIGNSKYSIQPSSVRIGSFTVHVKFLGEDISKSPGSCSFPLALKKRNPLL